MIIRTSLKKLRHELNLNQEEFAKKLGVSQSFYSAVERGSKKISKDLNQKIIALYENLSGKVIQHTSYVTDSSSNLDERISELGHSIALKHLNSDDEKRRFIQGAEDAQRKSLRISSFQNRYSKEHPHEIGLLNYLSFISEFEEYVLSPIHKILYERIINSGAKMQDDESSYKAYKEHKDKQVQSIIEYEDLIIIVVEQLAKLTSILKKSQFYELLDVDSQENIEDLIYDYKLYSPFLKTKK